MSDHQESADGTKADGLGTPTLVPVSKSGDFLVFGELPDWLNIEPVPYVPEERAREFGEALAASAGIGNVLIQGWNAYQGSIGVVRLAPETLAALRAGAKPLTQGGWALGTLVKGGKFAASVRWAPAGAAGLGAALTTLGPALAIVAVQWQLSKIGKAVERNIELTQTVLDHLREDAWYELDAAARIVLDSVRAATAVGEVTDLTWDHLQTQSTLPMLLKHRQLNLDALTRKLDALSTGKPSEWYQSNYAAVLRHSQAVMTAQQAISLHHIVRVAHARRTKDPRHEALAEYILDHARDEHEVTAQKIDLALRTLHRSLALWYEVDPGKKLSVFKENDVPLLHLRDAVADLHLRATAGPFRQLQPIAQARTFSARRCIDVADRDRPHIEQRLRWILDDEEVALLLCNGSYRFADSVEMRLLVVTERRALLVNSRDLNRGRAVILELPVDVDLKRAVKDGYENVEIDHSGRHGVFKTKTSEAAVFNALEALKVRVAPPQMELST